TLSRKLKARDITRLQYKEKGQELEADWELFIQIQMNDETVSGAKDLTKNFALRGSDAVHLSSALLLQSRFTEKDDRLIVVVSDKELKEAARASGLDVVDPEEKE
ncbi:MAG: type II toxin-antitoxin system VapC family toxin, partial [Pseudomonadota bacterium]